MCVHLKSNKFSKIYYGRVQLATYSMYVQCIWAFNIIIIPLCMYALILYQNSYLDIIVEKFSLRKGKRVLKRDKKRVGMDSDHSVDIQKLTRCIHEHSYSIGSGRERWCNALHPIGMGSRAGLHGEHA